MLCSVSSFIVRQRHICLFQSFLTNHAETLNDTHAGLTFQAVCRAYGVITLRISAGRSLFHIKVFVLHKGAEY